MIKAVWKHGTIHPLDPVPDEWADGQQLVIDTLDAADEEQADESWADAVCREMAAFSDEDHEKLMAAIATHRAEQKELMRQQFADLQ
jgi:hypothetical protein